MGDNGFAFALSLMELQCNSNLDCPSHYLDVMKRRYANLELEGLLNTLCFPL